MRRSVRIALALVVTGGLLAIFFRNADLERVWAAVLGAHWDVLAVAMLLVVASQLLRIVRWRYVLRGLGPVRFGNALRATAMGAVATVLIPGRTGELVRPYVVARKEGLSAASTLGTVVVERMLDLFAVLALFWSSAVMWGHSVSAETSPSLVAALRVGTWGAAGVLLGGALGAYLIATRPQTITGLIARVGRALPGRIGGPFALLGERFVEGLTALREPRTVVVAIAWSMAVWIGIGASLWLVSAAFGISLLPTGVATLVLLTVIGVAIPTPAGIGGFHAAYQFGATALYGASVDASVGSALLLHAISFFPPAILGIVFMLQEGIRPGRAVDPVAGGSCGEPYASRQVSKASTARGERGRRRAASYSSITSR